LIVEPRGGKQRGRTSKAAHIIECPSAAKYNINEDLIDD
jgi:hypothetical protein